MSNMEKCGHSKSDQNDQKLDDNNRNHPANKKDESEFQYKLIEFLNLSLYFTHLSCQCLMLIIPIPNIKPLTLQ